MRDAYLKQNVKIKFDYAVISSDDVSKTINPSDSDLEAFFKKNAARYTQAVPEERKITYFAFNAGQVPGGSTPPTQQQIQQYYNDHLSDYSVPEQATSRHILISVPEGADARPLPLREQAMAQVPLVVLGGPPVVVGRGRGVSSESRLRIHRL